MRQIDDNIIIEKSLQGDLEAFAGLVKKYQDALVALGWNILGDRDDARDVAQEAFIQAFTHLERFDTTRSFKTWIFSIAVKRSIDRLRRQKSSWKYFNRQTKEQCLETAQTNISIEDSRVFSPLLKRLNPKERMAISLKINEGYSAKEIGEVIRCSESTARVHLFNAKKKLKKELSLAGKSTGKGGD
ncbi:MAG: sigma-70 family RNA polymerase sigma factor [Candidatus Aminicenantes bacterium]|nr:sigma-70 family RNA polymerase sigma factor [Candidatus Aminicenantes bacterium]